MLSFYLLIYIINSTTKYAVFIHSAILPNIDDDNHNSILRHAKL